MKQVLLLLAILLLLPWTVQALDVTISDQDSIVDTRLLQVAPTTNYITNTTLNVGFWGEQCGNTGTLDYFDFNIDDTGYDTCSGGWLIITSTADSRTGSADTLDLLHYMGSTDPGSMTYNTDSSAYDTLTSSGFYQENGGMAYTSITDAQKCSVFVAHPGLDSMMQGLKTTEFILVARSHWRAMYTCPETGDSEISFRSEDHTTPGDRPVLVLLDVGIPAGDSPAGQIIIIGNRDAEIQFDRHCCLSDRHFLR